MGNTGRISLTGTTPGWEALDGGGDLGFGRFGGRLSRNGVSFPVPRLLAAEWPPVRRHLEWRQSRG